MFRPQLLNTTHLQTDDSTVVIHALEEVVCPVSPVEQHVVQAVVDVQQVVRVRARVQLEVLRQRSAQVSVVWL